MVFYEASGAGLSSELAAVITESTWLGQLYDDVRAEVASLQEMLSASDAAIRYIFEDSCALLRPSLRSLVENFYAGLNKPVSKAFCADSTRSQFHADAAIDCIKLRFPEGALSDDGDGNTKREGVVDPPADPEVIKL